MNGIDHGGTSAEKWEDAVDVVHASDATFKLVISRVKPTLEDFSQVTLVRGSSGRTSTEWGELLEWIKENLSRGDDELFKLTLRQANGHHVSTFDMHLGADPLRKATYTRRVAEEQLKARRLSDEASGKSPPAAAPPSPSAPPAVMVGVPSSNDPTVQALQREMGDLKQMFGGFLAKFNVDARIDEKISVMGRDAAAAAAPAQQPAQQQQQQRPPQQPVMEEWTPPEGFVIVVKAGGKRVLMPQDFLDRPTVVAAASQPTKPPAEAPAAPKEESLFADLDRGLATFEKTKQRLESVQKKMGVVPASGTMAAVDDEDEEAHMPKDYDPAVVKVGEMALPRKEDGTADLSLLPALLLNPSHTKSVAEGIFSAGADAYIKIQGAELQRKKEAVEIRLTEAKAKQAEAEAEAAKLRAEAERQRIASEKMRADEQRARTEAAQLELARQRMAIQDQVRARQEPKAIEEAPREADEPDARQENESSVASTEDAPEPAPPESKSSNGESLYAP